MNRIVADKLHPVIVALQNFIKPVTHGITQAIQHLQKRSGFNLPGCSDNYIILPGMLGAATLKLIILSLGRSSSTETGDRFFQTFLIDYFGCTISISRKKKYIYILFKYISSVRGRDLAPFTMVTIVLSDVQLF